MAKKKAAKDKCQAEEFLVYSSVPVVNSVHVFKNFRGKWQWRLVSNDACREKLCHSEEYSSRGACCKTAIAIATQLGVVVYQKRS